MYNLGITHKFAYNQAACLLKDGEIVAFAEEERFTRVKQAFQMFPINAINFCLKEADIGPRDIDEIATCWERTEDIWKVVDSFEFADYTNKGWDRVIFDTGPDKDIFQDAELIKEIALAGFRVGHIGWYDHHECHAASAVIASGFSECNYITYDGDGGTSAGRVGFYSNGKLHNHEYFHCIGSLGIFYERITEFLGFKPHCEEGKTMGLASYGKYDESLIPRDAFFRNKGGLLQIDQNAVKDKLHQLYLEGYQDKIKENILCDEAVNLAYTAQKYLEEMLLDAAHFMYKRTGCKNFAVAGGSLLNCSANGVLLNADFVDHLFVQPASHDAGSALGAAALSYAKLSNTNKLTHVDFSTAYFGSYFSREHIIDCLNKAEITYSHVDPATTIAKLIHEDKTVAYFSGKAEVGPRALCHRSILANPTKKENLERVNKIKNREFWRPLAPVVKEEAFYNIVNAKHLSAHMLIAAEVKEEWKEKIPAVTHVDGTCRPQSVREEQNPVIHKALSLFEEMSGVPVFMNTSFNLRGEPLVDSPTDALHTFFNSDLDCLLMEDILVYRE